MLSTAPGGMLILTTSNTYTGPTTVNGGTLQLGTAAQPPTNTELTVNTNGDLDLNQQSATVDGLNGGGTIYPVAGGPALTIGNANGGGNFSGIITGSQSPDQGRHGHGSSRAPDTYSGATAINAGIVNYQSATAFGTYSPITVAAGATRRCRATSAVGTRR